MLITDLLHTNHICIADSFQGAALVSIWIYINILYPLFNKVSIFKHKSKNIRKLFYLQLKVCL